MAETVQDARRWYAEAERQADKVRAFRAEKLKRVNDLFQCGRAVAPKKSYKAALAEALARAECARCLLRAVGVNV